jgi:hypothetical protein
METIFKAAVKHIRAKESTKRKTAEYLMRNLDTPSAVNHAGVRNPVIKRAAAAACAVIFACAISVGAVIYYKTPTSYLSLDINPSVELGVNTFGKVVAAMAYNSDGKTILNGQDLIDTDVKSAVHTLVKTAAQKGFVAKDGSTVIAVTSETDNSTTAAELEEAAAQGADAAVKSEGKTAAIEKENVSLDKREEAKKLNITPGKLNLIQKLQALDPSITVNEYKDAKVTDIMKKLTELKGSVPVSPGGEDGSLSPADKGQDSPDEAVNEDSQDTSKETVDEDSQSSSEETAGGDSQDTSKSTVSGDPQDASSKPVDENSQAPSGGGEKTSSATQSRTGSSRTAQSSDTKSRASSVPSSRSPGDPAEYPGE